MLHQVKVACGNGEYPRRPLEVLIVLQQPIGILRGLTHGSANTSRRPTQIREVSRDAYLEEELMHLRQRSRFGGFTLVELLVVIAIIAMLVSILLPAVQAAREAARQTQCRNNLKNDALATLQHVDAKGAFPIGVRGGNPTKASPNAKLTEESATGFCDKGLGWIVETLPYLEEQVTYDRVYDSTGLNLGPNDKFPFPNILQFGPAIIGEKVWRGGDTVLPSYRCPSSPLPPFARDCLASFVNGYATSDYKGSNGWADRGIFHHMCDNARAAMRRAGLDDDLGEARVITQVKPANITDGMSKTLLIGEAAYYISTRAQVGGEGNTDWPIWMGGATSDENTLFKTAADAPINCGVSPKSMGNLFYGTVPGEDITLQKSGPVDDDCAFSWHHGGAMFALCDGSVLFLPEDLDFEVYRRLGARNDGLPVSDYLP